MPDCIDNQGFRANVGIVLMRADGRVFLGGRTGGRGWQFPQGGINSGEDHDAALYRELREEVGLHADDVDVEAVTAGWLRYRFPRRFVRHDTTPVCLGQKQRWYLLRARGGADSRVRFDRTTEPPEFDRGRWAEWWEPVREVVWFKRDVYRRALHELGGRAFPDGLPPYPDWWEGPVSTAIGR